MRRWEDLQARIVVNHQRFVNDERYRVVAVNSEIPLPLESWCMVSAHKDMGVSGMACRCLDECNIVLLDLDICYIVKELNNMNNLER
jgi:hypothetical protein